MNKESSVNSCPMHKSNASGSVCLLQLLPRVSEFRKHRVLATSAGQMTSIFGVKHI